MSKQQITTSNGAPASTGEPPVAPMTHSLAIGQVMARSGLFPDITRVSQAVVQVLAGRELGIGPFAAMSDIHIIEGKPVIGARILAALVRQSAVSDWAPRSELYLNDAGRRSGGALRLLRSTKGGGMAATASHPSPVPALRGDEEALYRAHHIYLCGSSPTTSAPALR